MSVQETIGEVFADDSSDSLRQYPSIRQDLSELREYLVYKEMAERHQDGSITVKIQGLELMKMMSEFDHTRECEASQQVGWAPEGLMSAVIDASIVS